jgi:hypothetical protein
MSAETCAAVADQFNRAARAARAPSSRERTIIAAIPILLVALHRRRDSQGNAFSSAFRRLGRRDAHPHKTITKPL